MTDFASMMEQQGVRRLADKIATPHRRAPAPVQPTRSATDTKSVPDQAHDPAVPENPAPAAWATGTEARAIVQAAITKTWIEGGRIEMLIRRHGKLEIVREPAVATVAELSIAADTTEAEIVIIDGIGWKVIMHPQAGAATLVDNPPPVE